MPALSQIRDILSSVVREGDTDAALQAIIEGALTQTRARNALIGILDDEAGHLVISHGAGPEWAEKGEGVTLSVAVGKRAGITAYVAATGKTFVTGNVNEVLAYHHLFESTKSEMATPVRDQHGKLRAVLNLESERENAFDDESVEIAELFASFIALMLERDEATTREEALVEVGTALDDLLQAGDVLEAVIDVAGRVLRFQACSIFLFDNASQSYVLRASTGALADKVGQLSYQRGEGFTGWVCDSGQPILLDKPQQDPRWRGKFTEIPSDEIASFLAVPIVIRGKSMGAIRALRRVPDNEFLDNRFTEADLRLFQAISEQTAVALENLGSLEKILHAERMSAWGELSAKSSHMIGNRVFALKGDVNELKHLLMTDEPNLDELRELQTGLETNITRLQEILQDFRDFVTATQLNRSLGDLNQLVADTVREVFPKRANVELHVSLDEGLPKLTFDGKRLRLALSELIENALSFIDQGELFVSTGIASIEEVSHAKLSPAVKFAKVQVIDTGPGVDPERKETIFQPFFTSRVKGMGLGLSIVKGIADAHGGTVVEIGEPGKGANFMVLLPILERKNSGGI